MLTQGILKKLLKYDPETGWFVWISRPSQATHIGTRAGVAKREGYREISIKRKSYKAHRLAFLYMKGRWPKHEVDHRNGDKSDDSWGNLREATHSQNQMNKWSKKNTSGYKGVSWNKHMNVWTAQIQKDRKRHHIGVFRDPEDASAAYRARAAAMFGEFAYQE